MSSELILTIYGGSITGLLDVNSSLAVESLQPVRSLGRALPNEILAAAQTENGLVLIRGDGESTEIVFENGERLPIIKPGEALRPVAKFQSNKPGEAFGPAVTTSTHLIYIRRANRQELMF